jgi:hypothetical protein
MTEVYLLEWFAQCSIGEIAYAYTVPDLLKALAQNNVAPLGSDLTIRRRQDDGGPALGGASRGHTYTGQRQAGHPG